MTNTLNKIIHNGDEYEFPSGWWLPSGWTVGQILIMTSQWPAWADPTDVDIVVSDTNAPIVIRKLWWWTDTNYQSLQTFDNNEWYITVPDSPTP